MARSTVAIDIARLNAVFDGDSGRPRTWIGHAGQAQFFVSRVGDSAVRIEMSFPHRADHTVEVTTTPCQFGGVRHWFRCPSRECGRRVRIIYLSPGAATWACGRCRGRTYPCRQRHRNRYYEGLEKPAKVLARVEQLYEAAKTAAARQRVIRNALIADAALESSLASWGGRLDLLRD